MASLPTDGHPYDVLSPLPAVDSSNDSDVAVDDVSVDPGVDDQQVDDADAGEQDSADASDEDAQSAEGGDPDQAAADSKAEESAWKAKDGNIPPALKELIAQNPNAAKRLKEMYFNNQRYQKAGGTAEVQKMKEAVEHMGGVDKLLSLKNQIDAMGGEAGFQEATQELGAWRNIDSQWMNGDPALADHLATSNPESFEKIAPVMFGKLYDVNPELYNNLASQIIYQTFAQDGTVINMQMMKQALEGGNTKLAGEYLAKIEASFAGIQRLASAAPKARPRSNPQQDAFVKEKQTFENQRVSAFQDSVLEANTAWMDQKIQTELSAYLNGAEKKLSPNTITRINRAVKESIWNNHLGNNEAFNQARNGLYSRFDKEGCVRLYKQYAGDKVWQKTVRDIAAEFSLSPAAKRAAGAPVAARPGAGSPKPEAGFQRTNKMPQLNEVDRSQTTQDMIIKDMYVLKDGRKVQYVPPTNRQ